MDNDLFVCCFNSIWTTAQNVCGFLPLLPQILLSSGPLMKPLSWKWGTPATRDYIPSSSLTVSTNKGEIRGLIWPPINQQVWGLSERFWWLLLLLSCLYPSSAQLSFCFAWCWFGYSVFIPSTAYSGSASKPHNNPLQGMWCVRDRT